MTKSLMSERFARQIGLVDQKRLADLRVLIVGKGPIKSHLASILTFIGVGSSKGCIYFRKEDIVTEDDLPAQILLEKSDIGKEPGVAFENRLKSKIATGVVVQSISDISEIEFDTVFITGKADENIIYKIDRSCVIYAQISKSAAFVGVKPINADPFETNILTASLAVVAASSAAQEMLRRKNLIRKSRIQEHWMDIRFTLQRPGIWNDYLESVSKRKRFEVNLRLTIGAEPIQTTFDPVEETITIDGKEIKRHNPDFITVSARFPDTELVERLFFDSVEIIEPITPAMTRPRKKVMFSPFTDTTIKDWKIIDTAQDIPITLSDKSAVFLGIGGLGSWSALLFNISNTENCTTILIDSDRTIEEHNLNRQILYKRKDIGNPKAPAAEANLKPYTPKSNTIRSYVDKVDWGVLQDITDDNMVHPDESEEETLLSIDIPGLGEITPSLFPKIAWEFNNSDIIISALDNLRIRYVMSAISKKIGKPFLNGGGMNFIANVDLFLPEGECFVCRYGEEAKTQREVVGCTGPIPTLSIATTLSLAGGIQGAVLMSYLAGLNDVIHYSYYGGGSNQFMTCRYKTGACEVHNQNSNCPKHLNAEHQDPIF